MFYITKVSFLVTGQRVVRDLPRKFDTREEAMAHRRGLMRGAQHRARKFRTGTVDRYHVNQVPVRGSLGKARTERALRGSGLNDMVAKAV